MRASVLLLIASLLGVLGGAALVDLTPLAVLGGAIIADSVAVGWWAVFVYDDGVPVPQPGELPQPSAWAVSGTVSSILDRARAAP